jgi:hypothetical protein
LTRGFRHPKLGSLRTRFTSWTLKRVCICIRCHDHSEIHAQKIMSGRYAKFILNSKSRHGMRSRFNAAGLITFDCQDARDRSQRTYIDGFMTKDDALKLSDS